MAGRTAVLGSGSLGEARSGSPRAIRGGSTRAGAGVRFTRAGDVAGHATGATVAGGDAIGRRGGCRRFVSTKIHVETGGAQRGKDGGVVGDGDIALHSRRFGVDIGVVAGLGDVGRSIVALNADLADHGIVVADGLDVLAVPVDITTGPVNGTLGVAGLAGGPERHLKARGCLGELVLLGGLVVGVGLFQSAAHGAVDDPVDLLRGPIDLVSVPVIEGVLAIHADVAGVLPWFIKSVFIIGIRYSLLLLTYSPEHPASSSWSARRSNQHRPTRSRFRP